MNNHTYLFVKLEMFEMLRCIEDNGRQILRFKCSCRCYSNHGNRNGFYGGIIEKCVRCVGVCFLFILNYYVPNTAIMSILSIMQTLFYYYSF